MPYHADLRCSYSHSELNMSWFYEYLSESSQEIDFKPTYSPHRRPDEQDEKQCIQTTINLFEAHIDYAFNDWVAYKVFGHERNGRKYELYCDVWEFLTDVMVDYINVHPQVVWVINEDSDEDEESSSDA